MFGVLRCLFIVGVTAASGRNSPESVLDRFQEAVRSGDREQAMSLLSRDVVIFEEGEAEMGLEEYATTHLGADIEFAKSTSTRIMDTRSGAVNGAAWVLRRSETTGTFGGKKVMRIGAETAVLRREKGRWRIVHLHWSGHVK